MSTLPLRHPLRREGASQITRLVQALRPETFRLDERALQDLIVATHRYAQTLRYFDDTDSHPEGACWDRFWEVEPLTYLAVLAATDTGQIRSAYEDADTALTREQQAAPLPGARPAGKAMPPAAYRPLIRYLREIAWTLEATYRKLVRLDHPLRHLLLDRIKRDNRCDQEELEGALKRLIAYHKGADPALKMSDYEAFFADDKHWGLAKPGRVDYDAIPANPNMNQNALRELFITFYDTWAVLKAAAQTAFDKELTRMELPEEVEFRVVQPHVALYLAFLRLFRHAQDSLNELGAGHLDFFYEKILGLQPRAESPDDVYLLFELAKNVDEFLLEKGTELLAGKDAAGKPLLYETIEEWVLRSARVADIRNTRIDPESGLILANPDVRKQYSAHAEVPNEKAAHWRAFGDDPGLPLGEIGFAIASPQLILKEGKRVVDVKIKAQNFPTNLLRSGQAFCVALSSETAWVNLKFNAEINVPLDSESPGYENIIPLKGSAFNARFKDSIYFRLVLEKDDFSIVPFGEEMAQLTGFGSRWPIMKVTISPDGITQNGTSEISSAVAIYNALRPMQIEGISIRVHAEGIRENLIIQSDQGVFDGTQKVLPFGPAPEIGNRFYIGSTEVFQKALSDIVLHFEWIDPDLKVDSHYDAYKRVLDGKTPHPYVQVDFIDRASIPPSKQVVKFGKRIGNTISGIIKDVKNNPISFVKIETTGTTLQRSQKEKTYNAISGLDGTYTISGDLNATDMVTFNPPPQSDDDQEGKALYEILEKIEEQEIKIGDYETINAILFPKNIVYKKFKNIQGYAYDIYKNPIANIEANASEKTAKTQADGFYLLSDLGNETPEKIQFKIPDDLLEKYLSPESKIILDKFSKLNLLLIPKEHYDYDEDGEKIDPSAPTIEGHVSSTKDQSGIEGAYIEASDSDNNSIAVFSDESGKYELPLPAVNGSEIKFFPNLHSKSVISIDGIEALKVTSNEYLKKHIEATLRYPTIIEKVFIPPDTLVNIIIVNQLKEFLKDVTITSENSDKIEVILKGDPTKEYYEIKGLYEDSSIHLAAPGYTEIDVNIGKYTNLNILMTPIDSIYRSDEPVGSDNKISGSIMNLNGVLIQKEVTVEEIPEDPTIGAKKTTKSGTYEITLTTANKLKFSCAGYREKEVDNLKNRIDVVLEPFLAVNSGEITDSITGRIIDADGSPLPGLSIMAEGILRQKCKIRLKTNSKNGGLYSINRLDGVKKLKLNINKGDGYFIEIIDPKANTNIILWNQIQKKWEDSIKIAGRVIDFEDKPIIGAQVLMLPDGIQKSTDDNGLFNFELNNKNSDYKFKVEHSSYKTLKGTYEPGCREIQIRLIPKCIYRILKGTIRDTYGTPITGAQIKMQMNTNANEWEDTLIETKSRFDGSYELSIPYPIENKSIKIQFSLPDIFKQVEADLTLPGTFSKSDLDINLHYGDSSNIKINYTCLVDSEEHLRREFPVPVNAALLVRDIRTQEFTKYSPALKRGFLQFTLKEDDFKHKEYPKVLAWYAINASKEGKVVIPDGNELGVVVPTFPNPPYTPATNNISLDYSSTQVITGADNLDAENNPIDQYFQLLPFQGHKQIDISPSDPQIRLLYPYLPDDDATAGFANGNLFIGLSDLTPGGSLSLLVQVAEGTEAEPEAPAPEIRWSYLAKGNCWLPFGANADGARIIRDTTAGLTRSGILQFSIPTTAVKENTLLDPDYYWLRAAIAEESDDKNNKVKSAGALPRILSVDAQAVQARFKNRDNDLQHLAAPLPAGTISKMADTSTAVKSVTQPLESFGGRPPEKTGLEFYYRVSERLRHKDRAVTVWDHERLLLGRFPEIATAKCIPHTQYPNQEPASERAPGFVTVAVIPDLKKRKGEPWPEPRFTLGDLEDMRNYLTQRVNPLVAFKRNGEAHFRRLRIVNPLYEKLDVEVRVQFKPDIADLEQKTEQLRTALTHYISPWLAEAAKPPVFGRVLERSGILQFIEEQPYVDYVKLTDEGGENIFITKLAGEQTPAEAEQIRPGTARSILVAGSVCVNEKRPSELPPPPSAPDPAPAVEKPPAEGKKTAKPGKPKSAPKQRN